jgi:hypothetical protein
VLILGGILGGLLLVGLIVLAILWYVMGGIPWLFPTSPPTVMPAAPTVMPAATSASSPIPQECGMTSATLDYGSIGVGTIVILGRHRPVDGYDNWDPQMDAYVGMQATVIELKEVDGSGCPGVAVDVDGGYWFWRIRDLSFP